MGSAIGLERACAVRSRCRCRRAPHDSAGDGVDGNTVDHDRRVKSLTSATADGGRNASSPPGHRPTEASHGDIHNRS